MVRKKQQDSYPEEISDDSAAMKFIYGILRHRRAVIAGFALFTLLCALCIPFVHINYDLASYLPKETNSTQAIELMEEVYDTDLPNARLYAQGITLPEASLLATDLRDVEGVSEVLWLGDQVDIVQPLEVLDPNTTSAWMTDEGFLFQLTIDDASAAQALDEVRAVGYVHNASDVALSGDAVTLVDAQASTSTEVLYILLMAIVIIIVIISLTSESWFEWVIFLLVLAMAIIMNMGTNIVRGEISFITQICAAVLQLAVSMDYAIVVLHTFRRYQTDYPHDPIKAMAHAMHKGFSVVLSSAAVIFFGFLSLSVMSFLIGVDMGIVLAKGIFFSFFAVMFLMPCIILACLKPLKRFEHRPLLPSFDRFGNWCTKLMIPVSVIICVVAVPSFLGQGRTDFTYGAAGMTEADSQAGIEAQLIDDTFESSETWVMIVPEGQWADEKALVNDIETLPKVKNVVSYVTAVSERVPTEMAPESQLSQLISGGYSRIVIQTTLNASTGTDYDMVETVRELGASYYGENTYLAGTQVSEFDLKTTTNEDSSRVKLFSIGAIALVLMLMFRSFSIPLIVLLPIEISIWINLSIPYFTGQSINYIGYLVLDAVQLGASVDYAIIYTREYLEQRKKFAPLEAARTSISKSAITIMTSALILTIAGLSIFFIASNTIISEIGMLVGRGAFISMLMMFTLLPLLFVLCDWIIRHTSLGLKFSAPNKNRTAPVNTQPVKETAMARSTTSKLQNTTLALVCSLALIAGSIPIAPQDAYAEENPQLASTNQGKEEVVYTKFNEAGTVQGIYVVNGFHSDKAKTIKDPGAYQKVTNLSTTDPLANKNSETTLEVNADEDFYYKGELPENTELPWTVVLEYALDGKSVDVEELAGTSGDLTIKMHIDPTDDESVFVENYLMQVSGSFSSSTTSNLEAEGGSVAASGANHQVTFMMLPGSSGDFTITAQVHDFSFGGFTLVAVPVSLALDVDSFETDELSGSMDDLKDAVTQLDDGAKTLSDGSTSVAEALSTLSSMSTTLSNGSAQILQGTNQLSSSSAALAEGSSAFVNGVAAQAAEAAAQSATAGALAYEKQQAYVAAMTNAQSGLGSAQQNLGAAYAALASGDDAAMQAALDSLAVDLGTTGGAVLDVSAAIGTAESAGWVSYQAQASAYAASNQTCNSIESSYAQLNNGIQLLAQSTPGLSENYQTFDNGLNSYLAGVSTLNSSYDTFQQGMSTYRSGVAEFKSQTATIDQDLIDGIKDELKSYLDADYELHSFVDESNTEVSNVQFIFLTEPIEEPEEPAAPADTEDTEEETPWTRLIALFR